jgi:hypothetical protein
MAELIKLVDALRIEVAPMQDETGNFRVDVFALNLHQSFDGLPAFDYGQPPP